MSGNVLKTLSAPSWSFPFKVCSAMPPSFVSAWSSCADRSICGQRTAAHIAGKSSRSQSASLAWEGWHPTAQQMSVLADAWKASQPPQQKPRTPIFSAPRCFTAGMTLSCSFGPATAQGNAFIARRKAGALKRPVAQSENHLPHVRPGSLSITRHMASVTSWPPQHPPSKNKGRTTRTPKVVANSSQIAWVLPDFIPKISWPTMRALVPEPTT
mmetsp:Transcript_54531/g.165760  ORF Transcript_54531/g.165760 Transcript_54531/m.165760 type:complete len:213 (-) Transcript_54531:162-800(-)